MKRLQETAWHVWRGCRYLPGYGSHPGNGLAVLVIAIAVLVVGDQGLRAMLLSAGGTAVWVAPVYAYGAYCRSMEYGRRRGANDNPRYP